MNTITASEIKDWLARVDKDREWLAKECHVSKATVNGWLSAGRTIPKPNLSILQGLMGKRSQINPSISMTTFLRAQEIAASLGMTLEQWIEKVIDDEIKAYEQKGFPLTEPLEQPRVFSHLKPIEGKAPDQSESA